MAKKIVSFCLGAFIVAMLYTDRLLPNNSSWLGIPTFLGVVASVCALKAAFDEYCLNVQTAAEVYLVFLCGSLISACWFLAFTIPSFGSPVNIFIVPAFIGSVVFAAIALGDTFS